MKIRMKIITLNLNPKKDKEHLVNLSGNELWIARNEIYARHGKIFKNEYLNSYFNSCSWYEPKEGKNEVDERELNEVEILNLSKIISAENTFEFILDGKTVHPDVSLAVSPGSKQVLTMLADCGALSDILASGARVLECACGPCIGMGFSPSSGGVSVRTFNRNFEGRSGTRDAQVYLASPEVAAASALTGFITDPSTLGEAPVVKMPDAFVADDGGVIQPADMEEAKNLTVQRGPNIKPFPKGEPLPDTLAAKLTLKVGDNITTDHIMPAGAKILPFRSNVPKLSEFCFTVCDEQFPARALENKRSFIIGGMNYGQGSSREHAALAPLHLGVRAVITKSFARIHVANLINAGILPLTFKNPEDYDLLNQDEDLVIENIYAGLESGEMTLRSLTTGKEIPLVCSLTKRQGDMLKAGGLLQYTKEMAE
mgnify:CR=1 FL=1